MSESKKEEEIGFFKKFYMSIFKVDEYSKFSEEKFSKSVKYFLLLLLLVAVLITIPLVYIYNQEILCAMNYIRNELPDFEMKDGKYVSSVNDIEGYDSEYDCKIYINTDQENLTEDKITEKGNELSKYQYGIFVMADEVRIYSNLYEGYQAKTYDEMKSSLAISDDTQINKAYILDGLDSAYKNIMLTLGVMLIIASYVSEFITYVFVMLVISIVGYTFNMLNDMKLKVRQVFSLAMYSSTLGILLVTTVDIIYLFKEINIQYITQIQTLISAIYLVAALMIIKSENNKVKQEVGAIVAEASGVVSENTDQDVIESDEKDDKKNDKEDKNDNDDQKDKPEDKKDEIKNDDEPDGSEI